MDDTKLIVKLGRALKVGECRVKIFQLKVNDPDVSIETIKIVIKEFCVNVGFYTQSPYLQVSTICTLVVIIINLSK